MATDPRIDGLVELLGEYQSADPDQRHLREEYLALLGAHPDALLRSCQPDHITASAIVLSTDGTRALLGFHRKGQFWGQLGGHIEAPDESVEAAACREVQEESGLASFRLLPGIAHLDRHELVGSFTCGKSHWDVQFACLADPAEPFAVSDESEDLRWFQLTELPTVDDATFQLISAALAKRDAASA